MSTNKKNTIIEKYRLSDHHQRIERCMMKKVMTIMPYILFMLLWGSAATALAGTETQGQNITTEQNKQLILRLFAKVFNHQTLSAVDEFYATDMVDHSAFPGQAPGKEGIEAAISGFFRMFDDLVVAVEDIIAENDSVVTRETWKGRYKISGKSAEGSVVHIFRIHDGKITDEWSRGWDWLESI